MTEAMRWPEIPTGGRYFTSVDACSCPDWKFRGRFRPCKHVKALREAYETIKAANRKWDMVKGETTNDERLAPDADALGWPMASYHWPQPHN